MSIALNNTHALAHVDLLRAELEAFAFDGVQVGRQYRIADKSLMVRRGWLVVAAERDRNPDDTADNRVNVQLGEPGLWRSVIDTDRGALRRVFEVPLEALSRDGGWSPNPCAPELLRQLASWALTTADAPVARDWSPPDETQLAAWISPGELAVRAGAVVRQGHIVNEPGRLSVRVPVTTAALDAIPEVRAAWLRELLADAQHQWRLVRFGRDAHNLVQAEVDLSGAPALVTEPLLRAAVATLRCAVRWLVRSVDFLVDTSVPCRALEVLAP